MKQKNYRAAAVARLAKVSRAAITKWQRAAAKSDWINIETKTLQNLAIGLGCAPDYFLRPRKQLSPYASHYLWDALYPNMEAFTRALTEGELPALARLVQVLGFHAARQIAGERVVTEFPRYQKFIKPVRRRELETLWPLYHSKG